MDWTIRKRMILLLIPAIIIVLAISTIASLQFTSTAEKQAAYDRTLGTARVYASEFNTEMASDREIPRTFSRFLEENTDITRGGVTDTLHAVLRDTPRIVGIAVVYEPEAFDGNDARYASTPGHDATGRFIPYWNRLSGNETLDPVEDIDTSDWYTIPKSTQADQIIEPYIYEGVLMTSYVSPVMKNKTFAGIVSMDVALESIDRTVSRVRVFDSGYAFLVSNNGTFVSFPKKDYLGRMTLGDLSRTTANPGLAAMASAIHEGNEGFVETVDPFSGKNVVMFYSPIRSGNWSMVVVAPEDEMLAGVQRLGQIMLVIGIFSILLIGVIILVVSRNISDPIVTMSRIADRVASGDLDARVPDQEGELGVLARAFNNMAGRLRDLIARLEAKVTELQKTRDALQESESKYRSILINIVDAFYRTDNEGILVMASPSLATLLGYDSPTDCIGKQISRAFYVRPGDREILTSMVHRLGSVRDYEIELRRKDGSTVFAAVSSHLYYNPDGTVAGIEGILRDITDRKRAEEAVRHKNEELQAAYAQLAGTEEELRQNFEELIRSQKALEQARRKISLLNAVTFDDIRSGIFSLAGYLRIQVTPRTDPKALEYIGKERAIVARIEHSLAFARNYQDLGMSPPRWQNVHQVFLFAISHLDLSHLERELRVNGLEIYADALLERVFFNLAENVVRHGKSATRIRLCAGNPTPSGLVIIFDDNGPGVPDSEKEKIFSRGYGESRGMGLYLVQEILGVTGITIRETGIYGQGTRFEILVPRGMFRKNPAPKP